MKMLFLFSALLIFILPIGCTVSESSGPPARSSDKGVTASQETEDAKDYFMPQQSGILVESPQYAQVDNLIIHAPEDADSHIDEVNLALDEIMYRGNTVYGGHATHLSYDEMLAYFPDMPIPQTFMGNAFVMGGLSLFPYMDFRPKDNEIVKIPATLDNIMSVTLLYQKDGDPVPFYNVMIGPGNYNIRGIELYTLELSDAPERFVYIRSNTDAVHQVIERRGDRRYCFSGPDISTVDEARAYIENAETQALIDAMHAWLHAE